jgi:hypothetical protein
MAEDIKPVIKKVLSQSIPDESIARQKMTSLIGMLKNTVNDIGNDWNSKEREDFIYNQVTSLGFIKKGDFILNNKSCVKELKSVYKSSDPSKFNTVKLSQYFNDIDVNSIYFMKEPFGSKASPDFLIISSNGILGIEDKSSKGGKVSFNTGTPGGNKFIMYYDKTDKKIYLISGKNWGWENSIDSEYEAFTKEIRNYAKNKFKERFGNRVNKNLEYYARPMLIDKNKIKDIWDKDEEAVMAMLRKHI